jgi:hypothetical protein
MRTTLTFQSVTFGTDNRTVVSNDHDHLNRGVQNPNAMSDSQKAGINIATRTGELGTWNSHSGNAQTTPKVTSVQLQQPTGRVAILGTTVAPDVYERMKETSPEAFIDPSVKVAEAAAEVADAAAEEITREDLNRHPDDQIEAAHQHFVGEVSTQNQVSLLVYAHRGEAPPADLINRIASEMHVTLPEAVDKINAISMATQAQFTVLARSMNLDADKAADWIKEHRKDTAMVAALALGLRRDLLAWKPLLQDYKAATGDGVKH